MSDKIKVLEEKIDKMEQTILSLEDTVSMMARDKERIGDELMLKVDKQDILFEIDQANKAKARIGSGR